MEAREFKFKAWNEDTRLMMRLDQIDCVKGKLVKKGHVLLQFTGLKDKDGTELYEKDIVLMGTDKFMILWDENRNGWSRIAQHNIKDKYPLTQKEMSGAMKLCSYYESPDSFITDSG